ncbi:thioredoxin family protein [Geodermatophilus sp. CPCC 206100]|uniref:thioredoxin family protein n=1 Tax=Geodermatophilus sp. CPCC 206100 TaxID=3020054 RepID=UPI003B00CBA8
MTLSGQDYAATVAAGIVVVDVRAPWYAPSRGLTAALGAVADRHPDVVFATVDAEQEPALVAAVGVRAVPTLLVYRDGVLVFAEPGALPADSVELLLDTVRELDMAAVREQFPER